MIHSVVFSVLSAAHAAPDFALGPIEECGESVWIEVENAGTTSTTGTWIDVFVGRASPPAFGEIGDHYRHTGTLGAGESAWYNVPVDAPASGDGWVDVILDTDQVVAEVSEANNADYIWAEFDTCEPGVVSLAAGGRQTCALLEDGAVRCWGNGEFGVLGYGNLNSIGDTEHPWTAGSVSLGGSAIAIAAGTYHTCALLTTGKVRCWGDGSFGQLGYANTNDIGDNEHPSAAGDVSLGGTAIAIEAGGAHTCAVLSGGTVRCWGQGAFGQLGYANTTSIGDNEHPSSVGTVSVGGTVLAMELGDVHTCAALSGGTVRCWGQGGSRLGYGHTNVIGDNEHPSAAGAVPTGLVAEAVALGGEHSCALSTSGKVRCWGTIVSGGLGYPGSLDVPRADLAGDITVGGSVAQLEAGYGTVCALLDSGAVRCWGNGVAGILGYANTLDVGDTETPAVFGDVRIQ